MVAQRKIALKANKQVVRTPKGIDTSPFPPSTSYHLYLFFAHVHVCFYVSAAPKNRINMMFVDPIIGSGGIGYGAGASTRAHRCLSDPYASALTLRLATATSCCPSNTPEGMHTATTGCEPFRTRTSLAQAQATTVTLASSRFGSETIPARTFCALHCSSRQTEHCHSITPTSMPAGALLAWPAVHRSTSRCCCCRDACGSSRVRVSSARGQLWTHLRRMPQRSSHGFMVCQCNNCAGG
jgi:hypothetical protein